jgi:hypothetical protein
LIGLKRQARWASSRGGFRARSDAGDHHVKGLRFRLRNFTALAVREHLRSQIERSDGGAELTPNEVSLVRFAAAHSGQLNELADKAARV